MQVFVDLHIHSCLSPCGDELMTPNNIARMSMLKELDIIAVADHNSAKNLPAVEIACREAGILLLPAIEVNSQEEAHMLAYFPTVEQACAFSDAIYPHLPAMKNMPEVFGEQVIMNHEGERVGIEEKLLINALGLSIDDLVEMTHAHGGAAVPAHINRGNNGLLNVLGFIPPGMPIDAVEVSRDLPCAAKLDQYRVMHSSDAHYLENISECEISIDLPEKSVEALFHWIRGNVEN